MDIKNKKRLIYLNLAWCNLNISFWYLLSAIAGKEL